MDQGAAPVNVPRKSIAYNSFFALVDKGYIALSNVALIPFIVHFLGLEVYGIWIILVTVSGYFQLANLGIGFSYEKCIAQFTATGDERTLKRFIVTAFYTSVALGVFILFVSQLFRPFVFHLLLKNDMLGAYSTIFFFLMLSGSCSLVTMILAAIPRGLQRFDFSSIISIGARTLYIISVVVLGMKGLGLVALVAAQYVFILVTVVLSLFFIWRFTGRLSLNPRFFSWSILKMMVIFGVKMQVSILAVIITQSFDKLLIAHFLGARVVALYDIGSRLVVFLKDFPSFLFASITSRTSELHSLHNRHGLRELYCTGTKYLSVLCLGTIPLLYPVAGEILTVWMRQAADPLSVYIFQILLVSTMVNAVTGLGSSISVGIGKPGITAYSSVVMTIVNMVCSTLFFYVFGIKGIVWGTAAGLFVATIVCFLRLNGAIDVTLKRIASKALFIPGIVNAGAAFLLVKLYGIGATMRPSFFTGGNSAFHLIAVNTLLVAAISAGMYAATRFITFDEVREYVPFLKKAPKK
jgi:O-antigen/teichoic acid export membrane protein